MKKLLLFLLFSTAAFAQIDISPLPDFAVCDPNNDEVATFDLTANTGIALGTLSPADYTVAYFETQDLANNNEFPIENPAAYNNVAAATTNGRQILYVRVTENANPGNYAVTTLTLIVIPTPVVENLPALSPSDCIYRIYNLTQNSNLIDPMFNVTYYASQADAEAGQNIITDPTVYETNQTSVWLRVANVPSDANAPACYTILQQRLNLTSYISLQAIVEGNTVTLMAIVGNPVSFSIISGPPPGIYPTPPQTSNVFTNLEPGMYSIQVIDSCGNLSYITLMITDIDVPAGETSQTFTEGQTLADLEVSGGNIQWYDAPTGGTLLPVTTPLVDNTTYYAESTAGSTLRAIRLAVTVHLVLSTGSNTLQTLSYYPNPVKNVLSIKNASPIHRIAVINTLGQQVLNKTINATETNINLTTLSNGIYFVKVQAGEGSKTIRIIKE